MKSVYGEKCPSLSTVKTWKRHLKCGSMSLEEEPREGRPCSAVDQDMVRKVERLVMEDRRMAIHAIMAEVDISYWSISTILHDHLNLSKVSAQWVPRLLTPFQKHQRADCASTVLARCEGNEDDFFDRLVTMDECWVYHFDPETKLMSKQWKHSYSPPQKKARVQPSAKRVMLSVFWDCKGIIHSDYLTYGHSVTEAYYRGLLEKLREALKVKACGKLIKGVRLLVDNAPAHRAQETLNVVQSLGYQLLPHPPYSPDLAPSDFCFRK